MKRIFIILLVTLVIVQADFCNQPLVNCQQCYNNGTTCSTCLTGFLQYQGNCLQCNISNCNYCKQQNQCNQCLTGFNLYLNLCIQCQIEECEFCSSNNVCSSCINASTINLFPNINGDLCIGCAVNNCEKCSTTNSCGQCKNGYQLYPLQQTNGMSQQCIVCSVDNCKSCSKDNFCEVCSIGYQNTINGICFLCGYPCTSCYQNNTCLTCFTPNFYINPALNGSCITVAVANCQDNNISNITQCIKCKDSFTYNSTSNQCISICSSTCFTCSKTNSSECLSCNPGFYLNGQKCQSCPNGCQECQDSISCQKALDGFYLSSGQIKICASYCKTCTSSSDCSQLKMAQGSTLLTTSDGSRILALCSSNCDFCSSSISQICIICKQSFYNSNGFCLSCNQICKSCDSTNTSKCLTCFTNSFLQGDTCILCDSNCLTCQSSFQPKTCTSCVSGSYINSLNQCINGCSSNCDICTGATTCSKCKDGYTVYENKFLNPVQIICVQCTSSCRKCAQNQPSVCLECGDGLYLEENICKSCPAFCRQCDSRGCLTCYKNYYLTAELTCSKNCNSPCATCSFLNPNQCKSCIAGYIIDVVTQHCIQETVCQKPCLACPLGYTLSLGKCLKCQLVNCERCFPTDTSICTSCLQGYFLDSTDSCSPCAVGCKTCLSQKKCTECLDGFTTGKTQGQYFQCVKCQKKCLTCFDDPTKCLSCQQGSKIINSWKCINNFAYSFGAVLTTKIDVFTLNYGRFFDLFTNAVQSKYTDSISLTGVEISEDGTITFQALAEPTGASGTWNAYIQYNNIMNILNSGYVHDMPIVSSTIKVQGGTVAFQTSKSSSNTGVIIGICIPLGILGVCGILIFYFYKKDRPNEQQGDDRTTDFYYSQGSAYGNSDKPIFQDNTLI